MIDLHACVYGEGGTVGSRKDADEVVEESSDSGRLEAEEETRSRSIPIDNRIYGGKLAEGRKDR